MNKRDDVYRDTLDTIADAVFHLDSERRLVWMNKAGGALVRSTERFRIDQTERFQTGSSEFDFRLADFCRRRPPEPLNIVIDARGDIGSLLVGQAVVAHQHDDSSDDAERKVTAVLVIYSAARSGDWGEVVTLFGLTAAEGTLAKELLNGHTLDEAAGRRGTSIHTVRNQLRSILAKTGTNRQSELIGLLTPFASRRAKSEAS